MVGKLVGRWKGVREGGWVGGRERGEEGRDIYVSFPLSPSLLSPFLSLSLLSSILHSGEAPREEGLMNLLPRSISLFPYPEEELQVNMPKVHK